MRGALQFLTRIPIRTRTAPDLTAAIPWFPVAGALIGALLAGLLLGLAAVVPMPVAAAVTVVLGVLLTGAFHEDGLADTVDAIGGGWDREQRVRILDDPLHGSYGVAAMVSSILLRAVALAVLSPAVAAAGLVAAHTLGRSGALAAMILWPAARGEGLGADYTRAARRSRIGLGIAGGVVIGTAVIGWWVLVAVGAVAISTAVMGRIARRALGGVTGDILGAVEQLGEIAVLLTVVALAERFTPLW